MSLCSVMVRKCVIVKAVCFAGGAFKEKGVGNGELYKIRDF